MLLIRAHQRWAAKQLVGERKKEDQLKNKTPQSEKV